MNNKVITIVVTYKRKELLSKVLNAIANQTHLPEKLLVIDNNSNDGTQELVEEIKKTSSLGIIYFNTGANLGGAGGFKFGIQKAAELKPDYIWLMDDDLVPDDTCLERLISAVDSNTICQPLRKNLDGSCAEYSPTIYNLSSPFILRPKQETVVDYINQKTTEIIPLQGIPFEGPLIPASLVDKIGLPDDRFFIFYDDLDYAIRARKAGYSINCVVNANATRLLLNNQTQDLSSWKGYFMLRNFFRIHRLHGENFLVRNRPLAITVIYVIKEFFKNNRSACKICIDAYKDHRVHDFKITRKYIP